MTSKPSKRAVRGFLAGLRTAPSRVLIMDYDGTLAPLVEDRHVAAPYEGLPGRLTRIRDGGTRLVIVSGRPLEEVAALLPLDPLPELWGAHGWERYLPGRGVRTAYVPERMVRHLLAAWDAAAAWVPAERLERKPASVAVHVRGLGPEEARRTIERVRRAWQHSHTESVLRVELFDGGIEARVPGKDKGTAVRQIVADEPEGASVAYLGDDLTDEDAFRALEGRALTVLVRPEPRPTLAEIRLTPPGEVRGFLDDWIRACALEGPRVARPLRLESGRR